MQREDQFYQLKTLIGHYAQQDIMVAFSGGVDSSLLLKMCCDQAAVTKVKVYAVTAQTMLHPQADIADAEQTAREMGAIHEILPVDELRDAGIGDNPKDRCYRCKKCIFTAFLKRAEQLGIQYILEGTNADDLKEYRPGIRAVQELGILSPLAEARLTKADVRAFAQMLKIPTAERPSAPCLATRFPYGTRLDSGAMRAVAEAEACLREHGFYNIRVRVHTTQADSRDLTGSVARVEVDSRDFKKMLRSREQITKCLHGLGFQYVALDLDGFHSGSMDIGGQIS